MTETPNQSEFERPGQIIEQVIGPVAEKLLGQNVLLLFDIDTGMLVSANGAAEMQLGLDLDNAIQPSFTEMLSGGSVDPDMTWAQLGTG